MRNFDSSVDGECKSNSLHEAMVGTKLYPGGFFRPHPSWDSGEAERIERVLARARAIFSAAALLAIYLDPSEPPRFYFLAYSLLFSYVAYSWGIVLALRCTKHPLRLAIALHVVDIVWITLLTWFTEGPNSPFFAFFTFVLVASAYRWGFEETFLTGAFLSGLFVCQAIVLPTRNDAFDTGEYDLNRFIIRSTYLMMISLLLGYLARTDKRLRAETALITRAMGKAQAEFGLSHTIEGVLEEIHRFYTASSVLLVVADKLNGRAYLTEYDPTSDRFHKLRMMELHPSSVSTYLFASESHAWHTSSSKVSEYHAIAIDESGNKMLQTGVDVTEPFLRAHPCESFLAVAVTFGKELSGRLYILNPRLQSSREIELAFISRFARQVTPSIYNVYLWRKLKAKVGAIERARIARDLHDGVIQSLTALALQVERDRNFPEGQTPRQILHGIPALIRNEIHNLRGLITQLGVLDLRPGELVPFLVDMAEKFRRETGIAAKVVSETEDVVLPPRVCREIVAIVREALTNTQKHAGAKNVLVNFACHSGLWTLIIDDDGSGFDFSGKMSLAELDDRHKGPTVIKERVRLLKANLTIESRPGAGSRLEISAPVSSKSG
jgi:signal transduction histidine kinase